MCSAELKARNFQLRTEPIRLFSISNFPSIVKDELAVLQQRAAVQLPAKTRITYDTLLALVVTILSVFYKFQFLYMVQNPIFYKSILPLMKHEEHKNSYYFLSPQ